MYPILYENVTPGVVPRNYGIGVLTDAVHCEVREERNGEYELTLKYPACGKYANDITTRSIIKAKPNYSDSPQLFRVYKVGKVINSSFTVKARHISYDLCGTPIYSGLADNVADALQLLKKASTGYTFSTDKTNTGTFRVYAPSSVRSWLGGKDGSILDIYGPGEYHYDNFNIQYLAHRGTNRGVTIEYGKNLVALNNNLDSSSLVTSVMAYWQNEDNVQISVVSDIYNTGLTLDVPVTKILDASDDFENQPTTAQLNTYVQNYINNNHNKLINVKNNITLDFLQLKSLNNRVDLCDTVKVVYKQFGIDAEVKCISVTWDVLTEKYTSAQFGEPRTNLVDTLVGMEDSINSSMTVQMVKTIVQQTASQIISSQGGYVFLRDKDLDGYFDELLVMNTMDINTATKIYKWDKDGLSFSNSGYNGTFYTVANMTGQLMANRLNGDIILGGTMNPNGHFIVHKEFSEDKLCDFNKQYIDINVRKFSASINDNVKVISDYSQADPQFGLTYSGLYLTKENVEGNTRAAHAGMLCHMDRDKQSIFVKSDQNGPGLTNPAYTIISTEGNSAKTNQHARYIADTPVVHQLPETAWRGSSDTNIENIDKSNGNLTASISSKVQAWDWVHDPNDNAYVQTITSEQYFQSVSKSFGTDKGTTVDIVNGNTDIKIKATDSGSGITMPNISINSNNGNITCTSLTQTSSKKVKKNINDLSEDEAKKVLELRPVTYDFKNEDLGTDRRGFIAEEVEEVIPELVNYNEDVVSLDYISMIPYLTKMIQLQQTQINELKEEINKLKGDMTDGTN